MHSCEALVGKPQLAIADELGRLPLFVYRQALNRIAASYETYHPVQVGTVALTESERTCADRWIAIEKEILECRAETLLDLGCAEGYFVQKAAMIGCLALGVDGDVRRLALAHGSTLLNRVQGAGFLYADITPEMVSHLPVHDIVLLQSVLHHVMYSRGVDYARELMQSIRPKVGKAMIFDMGQSDEKKHAWAKDLPDMGPEPHRWIENFLRSAGFRTVEKISESDAYQSTARRAVFRLVP
ncbi:MAG: hypothetical protein V4555_04010 [Acidobacteriota bacterium]